MSGPSSNTSTDSDEAMPFTGKQDSYANNGDEGQESSELLRTLSNYTEYNIANGEAARLEDEKEHAEEEGLAPPKGPQQYPLFSKENKALRISTLKQYILVILLLFSFVLSVWSIYWGSMYKRSERFVNLKILVAVEDDLDAPITEALIGATQDSEMKVCAGWDIRSGLTEDQVIDLVFTQKYWASVYVTKSDVSTKLTDAFHSGTSLNATNFVKSYYETGRDPNTMLNQIEPVLFLFGGVYTNHLQGKSYPSLISNLTSEQFSALQNTNILTEYPTIQYTDGKPLSSEVLFGPLQVGLIYIVIITFFQVMWMMKINGEVAKSILPVSYIIFRMVISQVTYLFLSLSFTCLNAAFQIDMNQAWSGGFGVMWMISFLTMSAVGGANENLSLLCFATLPPLMGFWVLFFVMINISATFAPIELCAKVYRFTYAMPIKNSYELMKVLLFNTYRGDIGRNFGILVAWIAVNNLLMPLCLLFFATMMKKKIIAEEKARKMAEAAKLEKGKVSDV